MKPPKIKVAMKMPMPAPGRALKAGQSILAGLFAHHPPSMGTPPRMDRPGKPGGPRN